MNKRGVGTLYEEKACRYLKEKNYEIVCKNFYYEKKEIDIIAVKGGDLLVFIEVKYRNLKSKDFNPYDSISYKKMTGLMKAAEGFLASNEKYRDFFSRYDVILILSNPMIGDEEIVHLKNAFCDEGGD